MSIASTSQEIVTIEKEKTGLKAILSRNFILLWLGEAISLIGDQFYLIALPWLTLQLTGDPFAMGAVLAVGGIPRALFMLVGGAFTDRFSARTVMLVSNLLRMLLVAILAIVVIIGSIKLWMLYIFALIFGLVDAFFFPAQSAIVPRLVDKANLQRANSIVMMTQQLSLFAGPVLAGIVIAMASTWFSVGETASDLTGLGITFGLDALTFLVSAITLWFIRIEAIKRDEKSASNSVLSDIQQGFNSMWQDIEVRSFFLLIIIANVLIVGPMSVGIPVLADSRLPEGAAAFGIIMSAFGGGSLLGMILAGILPKPPTRYMGIVIGLVWSGLGVGIFLLGLAETTTFAALTGFGMGAANGYVVILFVTWLQNRTADAMLGRMMGFLMFATTGLNPVSNALAGAVISWNPTLMFMGAGALMVLIVVLAMIFVPTLRSMTEVEAAI
jgi:MFS family permease